MDEMPPARPPSLAGRLRAAAVSAVHSPLHGSVVRREWAIPAAVALLIAAGPLATLIGADVIVGSVRAEADRLRGQAAPRVAAAQAAGHDRAELVALLRRPSLGSTVEALARALPTDASLLRVERDAAGLLEVDIAAPDPDRLRAALRREPALARLRDAGQQQGELAMTVTLREASR